MKALLLVLLLGAAWAAPASPPTYNSKYDNVNLDEVLRSERLLNNYLKCLFNEGPCTPDGLMLKETLPDAIDTGCEKCTEKQRVGSMKVIDFILENRPDDWEKMEKIYDPDGVYKKRYLAEKEANTTTIDPNQE